MDRNEVATLASKAGVKVVSFVYCDNGGILRSKSIHVSNLVSSMESGIGMSVAMPAMSSLDSLQSVPGKTPVGEIRLVPDPDSFTILPYAPAWAMMMANMCSLDREVWPPCTRGFLQRMIRRAADAGITIKAAFEPEWTLAIKKDDGRFVPCDESLCYSTIGMTVPRPVIEDIIVALEAQGVQIEQYYPELGHGQQELSVRFDNALRAADNHILYRETVRNIAWKHGYVASFAPKPFVNQAGNGCHIHLSAWDAEGGTNLFYSPEDSIKLSVLARHFIAGVLAHLPGLVALTCPSVNSYRRLQPRAWSSAFTCYGPDNREAAIRIPSLFWGRESMSANIEIKAADSSANPYIALAGVIAAGLDGIERTLALSNDLYLEVDPATLSEAERSRRGISRLPDTLGRAVSALENDTFLIEALGHDLANSYLAVRRGEIEYYSSHDDEFEFQSHFYKY